MWFGSVNWVALCGDSGRELVWEGEERVDNETMEFAYIFGNIVGSVVASAVLELSLFDSFVDDAFVD